MNVKESVIMKLHCSAQELSGVSDLATFMRQKIEPLRDRSDEIAGWLNAAEHTSLSVVVRHEDVDMVCLTLELLPE